MNSNQYLDKENWFIILIFIGVTLLIMKTLPHKGLEWVSFVLVTSIIGITNSIVLSIRSYSFSKISKRFLGYRIFWSLSFSIYVILMEFKIFPNYGLYLAIFFYCLALLDIVLNILISIITTEVGPGFIPKNLFNQT